MSACFEERVDFWEGWVCYYELRPACKRTELLCEESDNIICAPLMVTIP